MRYQRSLRGSHTNGVLMLGSTWTRFTPRAGRWAQYRFCPLCAAAVLLLAALPAKAQNTLDFPAKPIRLVVGFSPGGISDLLARALGSRLAAGLKQQVLVDNRAGAGTTIASALVAKSPPDGYTLFMQDLTTHAINATLYRKLPYDSLRDFTPIGAVAATPVLLVVHPSLPVRSIRELVALAKAKPGDITYASAGNGTILHLTGEMLKSASGIDLLHVPYKGGADAVQAVMSGQAAIAFAALPTALQQVKAGRLRAVAITTAKRVDAVAEVPTFMESGLRDFVLVLYSGVLGPPGMPKEIVSRLNSELAKAVHSAEMKPVYAGIGAQPLTNSPEELAAFLASEQKRLGKVVEAARVRID
ncbi:MAG: Bug family tripartite tricarboxylate transporter substrate binding protein [Burkholderiales bacterium]